MEPTKKSQACPKNKSPQLTCPLAKSDNPQFLISLACVECVHKSRARNGALGPCQPDGVCFAL